MALALADLLPPAWQQPWILALRLLPTCGFSLCSVSAQPFLAGVTSSEERPHAFAVRGALSPLGTVVGSLLGGFLPGFFARIAGGSLDQPRPYGYALAAGMLVYIPVIWALSTLRETGLDTREKRAAQEKGAVPYALLGAIGLVCFLRVGGEFSTGAFFNVYLDSAWSVPTATIGGLIAVANLLTIPAPLLTPPLVQRWGRLGTVLAGALGVAASVAALALVDHWVWAAVAFVCMTILAAMVRSVWVLMTQEVVAPEWRPMAAGVSNLTAALGVTAMSAAGGYIAADFGYRSTFATGAVDRLWRPA